MQPVIAQRILDAASLDVQNNAITITTGDIPDWNQKEVNKIFINTLAQGVATFTEAQYSTLASIATQCPLTGGSAVFKARSLLSVVEDVAYDDEDICLRVNQRQANLEKVFSNISIFPNPAKNEITVIFPHEMEGVFDKVNIYDALGLSVLEKTIPEKSRSILIDTSELKDGLYWVKVHVAGKKVLADKLIIIH